MSTSLENKLNAIYEEKVKIIPENVKKDVTIFGVTGTLEEGSGEGLAPIHIHRDAVAAPTVTVSVQNDGLYGFVDDTDGWYKNNNQNIDNSTASAVFTVNASEQTSITILMEQASEVNYDYATVNGISYKGKSGSFTDVISLNKGDNIVTVTYTKDSSASQDTDTFRIKFDLSSVQGVEEIDLDVYATHFASMEDMINDTACKVNTFAITYIDILTANIYRKTEAGWVFVGVSNNANFVHNNVVRGVKIGELTGTYISSLELNGLSYDVTTGNIVGDLGINVDSSVNFAISQASISIAPNNVGTLTILYSSSATKDIEGTLCTGNKLTFSPTNGELATITTAIANCPKATDLAAYLTIDGQWVEISANTEVDDALIGIEMLSTYARYSPLFQTLNYSISFNNTVSTIYEIDTSVNDIPYTITQIEGNLSNMGLGGNVDMATQPETVVIKLKYHSSIQRIDSTTFRKTDSEDETCYVDFIYSGTYRKYVDSGTLGITFQFMTSNMANKGYICNLSFSDNAENVYTWHNSGTVDTSYYKDFNITGELTVPIDFTIEIDIVSTESKLLFENQTLPVINWQETELLTLDNASATGNDIDGYTLSADIVDAYPNGLSISIEDTSGTKYTTTYMTPPGQLSVNVKKLGENFLDDLVIIGTRNGYFDDYNYDYNENLERTGDNSGTLLFDDVDLTDSYGVKLTGIKLQLFDFSSDVSSWYNAYITNKDLLYTKLIPPIMQDVTSIKHMSIRFNEHYLKSDGTNIYTSYSSVHGGNGDSSTYFGHSGGGYQRSVSILQATNMSLVPAVVNDNLTFMGTTGLIAQDTNFVKYAVRDGWSVVDSTQTVYAIYEGLADTPTTKQAINTYWTDNDEIIHELHVDYNTCEANTSEWYLKINPQGYNSTQGLLQNNDGEYMAYNPLTNMYVKVIDYIDREEQIKVTPYWMDTIYYSTKYGYDADGNIYTSNGFSTIIEE